MRMMMLILGLVVCTGISGCHSRSNIHAEQHALRTTEQQWLDSIASREVEKIVQFWTDDASVYPPGMPVVRGKEAIRKFVADSLNIPGFSITWQPNKIVVSPDGQLGYTTGSNRFTMQNDAGEMVTTNGRYVTVWRKELDDSWRCVVDSWNVGPDP